MTLDGQSLLIPTILSTSKLDVEYSLFKLTMANFEVVSPRSSESNGTVMEDFVNFQAHLMNNTKVFEAY